MNSVNLINIQIPFSSEKPKKNCAEFVRIFTSILKSAW